MMVQTANRVSIKGIRDGLLISLGAGPFEDAIGELALELQDKHEFLRGSRVALAVGDRYLDRDELTEAQTLLAGHGMALWAVLANQAETKEAARELGLATRLPGSNIDLDGNVMVKPVEKSDITHTSGPGAAGANGSNSLLLQETIRSGRSIIHDGHVVIIGDVNPGAEIIAGGNVVVWGRLRGLVHAGAYGNDSAVICALELIPTQLRIADQIAISPHEQRRQSTPEKVSIHTGQLVAELWHVRR